MDVAPCRSYDLTILSHGWHNYAIVPAGMVLLSSRAGRPMWPDIAWCLRRLPDCVNSLLQVLHRCFTFICTPSMWVFSLLGLSNDFPQKAHWKEKPFIQNPQIIRCSVTCNYKCSPMLPKFPHPPPNKYCYWIYSSLIYYSVSFIYGQGDPSIYFMDISVNS